MELGDDLVARPALGIETYEAKTLQRLLEGGRRLPVDDVLELGLRLSDAVYHLHEAGLLHRDVKPSNILFVAGRPKLADIGLVTEAGDAKSLVGTPGYIPPEGPGSRQADLYALGKVLYECLTGLDRTRFPELPTSFDAHPDRKEYLELNEILLRACHPDVQKRYATVRQLHADLTAVENGESVVRLRELEKRLQWFKRVSRLAAVGMAVLGVVLLLIQRELSVQDRARQLTAGTKLAGSMRDIEEGDYARALQETAAVIGLVGTEKEQRLNRLRFGSILQQMPKLTLLQGLGSAVTWCAFTPDGTNLLIGLADGRCQIRNAASGDTVTEFLGHSGTVNAAAVSPDGLLIVTASSDGTGRLWEKPSGKFVRLLPHPGTVTSVAFHPDGNRLATGCVDGTVRLWDVASGELRQEMKAHAARVEAVQFNHAGDLLASAGDDKRARLWRSENMEPMGPPLRHESWVFGVDFSLDDQQLLTACADHAGHVWSVSAGIPTLPPLRHGRGVRFGQFSPGGPYIATAGWDEAVCLWEGQSGRLKPPLLRHSSPVSCLGFSGDGRRLVTGCTDGTLRVWDQAGRRGGTSLRAGTFSADATVLVRTNDARVEVFGLNALATSLARIPTTGSLAGVCLNRTGTRVATVEGSTQRVVRVWSATNGQALSPAIELSSSKTKCSFDSTGDYLALVENSSVAVVAVSSGRRSFAPIVKDIPIREVSFSPDGRRCAVVAGHEVDVRDLATGRSCFASLVHPIPVEKAVFSPNSEQIVTCTSDQTIHSCYAQVWDLNTGQPVGGKLWHRDGVKHAAWCSDGQRLVTVGEDGVGQIWQNGQPVGTLLHHQDQIESVAVGGQPEVILTASWDATARLWDAETGLPIGPAYRCWYALVWARIIPNTTRFVTHEIDAESQLHEARPADEAVETLREIADVLAGRSPRFGTADEFEAARALIAAWQKLRGVHPELFAVPDADALAWHYDEAGRCAVAKLRRPELLHLNEILRLAPNKSRTLARKAHVEEVLRNQAVKPRP